MRTWNRTAVIVTPKQPFLGWLHFADPTSLDLTMADVRRESTIYLLPESGSDKEATELLRGVCDEIFEEQLNGWYQVPDLFPQDRSFVVFQDWFDYQFYSMVVDTCNDPLIAEEM